MPGELVATHRKGREGVVIVGESKTAENAIDVIEGMQFEAVGPFAGHCEPYRPRSNFDI